MSTLPLDLRNKLERTCIAARNLAEKAAKAALESLAVQSHEAYGHMTKEQKDLRNKLRAHARQLGDTQDGKGQLSIKHLAQECAYEHWHRMLFARFLAENNLLIEPAMRVAVSLDECKELAKEAKTDLWVLAGRFAQTMLPEIFRADDPVLQVSLAKEDQLKLEQLLDGLPADVFTVSDSLGWCYQFWQTQRKKQVNDSGVKIGADELPAVTQLFTEDYMVDFLLDNTLGAWHAGKILGTNPKLAENAKGEDELRKAVALPGVSWKYLRFVKSGATVPVAESGESNRDDCSTFTPAAGTFDGWPKTAKELKCLDPCMGSGHFVVAMFERLVALRMAEEKLDEPAAVAAVIRDNLFGLEIDPRCTQIGAFNLALAAWRRVGHRPLPEMNLACSGLAPNAKKDDWVKLAEGSANLRFPMGALYDLFQKAPVLGSLINPRRDKAVTYATTLHELQPLLDAALKREESDDVHELAVTAQGIAKAAEILAGQFTLVATNVPYLGRGKQVQALQDYCESLHAAAKADLATCFVERCLDFCASGKSTALVTPQSWLFMGTYKKLRNKSLASVQWDCVARLGPGAFETISGEVVNVVLLELTRHVPDEKHAFSGLDVTQEKSPTEKAEALHLKPCEVILQKEQLTNPDARISFNTHSASERLSKHCSSFLGLGTGDYSHYGRCFWEFANEAKGWAFQQCTVESPMFWGGREHVLAWDRDVGRVRGMTEAERVQIHNQDQSGQQAWGKRGVAVGLMQDLRPTLYTGETYEKALAVLVPTSEKLLPALWTFCSDPAFNKSVRELEHNVIVANGTLVKVPFDLAHWQKVAAEKYPYGLPKPFSNDPTQWLFNGYPVQSGATVPVAQAGKGHPDDGPTFTDTLQQTVYFNPYEPIEVCERNLPHWRQPGVSYFVTFRLADALPAEKLKQMRIEREAWLKTHAEPYSEADQQEYFRLFSERVQDWLDAGAGSCLLRNERAAEIVANALKHFDGQRYELGSWVVMPNHVHAVVTPREGWDLDKILHSWKSFTSHEIDKTLGRSGTLWQHEGYDHIVRNPRALWRIEQYIAENPAKAGITTKWVHSRLPEKSEATIPVAQFSETGNRDDCSTFNELELIRASGSDAADLEDWLRNDFFAQHCDLFHQRPFLWHIWDGRKRDGFHALVNYHKLAGEKGKGRRTLESLTHSYLGDWVTRQKDSLKREEEGAEERLAAALALKERLEAIIEGEPPFDIFVRWKPLDQQAIGWEPDINDGVRMNIRPFLTSDLPNGKKGAGILRSKPNMKWDKDRGNEPQRPKEDFPWFWKDGKFTGERVNDVHLTNDVKRKARKA